MNELEIVKANLNWKTMKEQSPEYATEEWFPQDVDIVEGQHGEGVKEEAFMMYPES